MLNFEKALFDIDQFCNENKLPYTIMGGFAVILHGYIRTTEDIDINLMIKLEDLVSTAKKILLKFDTNLSDPITFFQTNFVLPVIHKETRIGIDFTAGLTGFDEQVLKRTIRKEFFSLTLPCITVEDLIIYKLFASRKKDIADLEEIAKIHNQTIDRNYLADVLRQFDELHRDDMSRNFKEIFGD
jgi:predicted nucleotidyltransferase